MSFLSPKLENSISHNIRNFFGVAFFYFSSSESSFLKCKNKRLESYISGNIKNFFEVDFLNFFQLGIKSGPGIPIIHNYLVATLFQSSSNEKKN